MNTSEKLNCYECGKYLIFEANEKISRTEECNHCYASLHCCKMCEHYSTTSYNDCRESNASRMVEKTKSNFCDYFILKDNRKVSFSPDELFDQANSLFKN